MTNHMIVTKLPSNPNILYAVLPMPSSHIVILRPIIEELTMKGAKAIRTLIFCRLYGDVIRLYQMMALELDMHFTSVRKQNIVISTLLQVRCLYCTLGPEKYYFLSHRVRWYSKGCDRHNRICHGPELSKYPEGDPLEATQ